MHTSVAFTEHNTYDLPFKPLFHDREVASEPHEYHDTEPAPYKPLFDDTPRQRKEVQEAQIQFNSYDRVIQQTIEKIDKMTQSRQKLLTASQISDQELENVFSQKSIERMAPQQQFISSQQSKYSHESVKNNEYQTMHQSKSSDMHLRHQTSIQPAALKQQVRDDIGDVMQQMQSLAITPVKCEKNVEQPVEMTDEKTKVKIMNWLRDVGLVKKQVEFDVFPKYCRNGVLYSDLLNLLSGRSQPIKGIFRNPNSIAQINSNFDKLMSFLKEFPRFSSRFLWSQQKIINGEQDIIWGFFDDIWYWSNGKISPFDPAANIEKTRTALTGRKVSESKAQISQTDPKNQRQVSKAISQFSISQLDQHSIQAKDSNKINIKSGEHLVNEQKQQQSYHSFGAEQKKRQEYQSQIQSIDFSNTPASKRPPLPRVPITNSKGSGVPTLPIASHRMIDNQPRQLDKSPTPLTARNSYSNRYSNRNQQYTQSQISSSRYSSKSKSPIIQPRKSIVQSKSMQQIITYTAAEQYEPQTLTPLQQWLKQLGLSLPEAHTGLPLLEDPLRNGTYLCELVQKTEHCTLNNKINHPKNIQQCRDNFQSALAILPQTDIEIEDLIIGVGFTELLDAIRLKSNLKKPSKQNLIPYTDEQIKCLDKALISWLQSIKVCSDKVESISDIMFAIKRGVILCDLVGLLFNCKITGVVRQPLTETSCISNIRKAMEVLRKQKRMSQKFTWSDQQVVLGNFHVVFGLLEDLYRCADGLPIRKRGLDYFIDGPYLGQINKN